MKFKLLGLLFALPFFGFFTANNAFASTTVLTSSNAINYQINGVNVVWAGLGSNGSNQIFLYNIASGTTTQVTNGNFDSNAPQVNNGIIVWQQSAGDLRSDIYMYNISTGATTQMLIHRSIMEILPGITIMIMEVIREFIIII